MDDWGKDLYFLINIILKVIMQSQFFKLHDHAVSEK